MPAPPRPVPCRQAPLCDSRAGPGPLPPRRRAGDRTGEEGREVSEAPPAPLRRVRCFKPPFPSPSARPGIAGGRLRVRPAGLGCVGLWGGAGGGNVVVGGPAVRPRGAAGGHRGVREGAEPLPHCVQHRGCPRHRHPRPRHPPQRLAASLCLGSCIISF